MTPEPALRIAHIDTGTTLRGGQRQMLMLAEGLRERGHQQVIVCLEGSALETVVRNEGFESIALPESDPWHAFGVLLWRQQIKTLKPQIIHAHDGRGQSLAWFASVGLPVKRVASRRVTFVPSDGWTYRLKYGRTCDAVIAVSNTIKDLATQSGVNAEKIAVIPDGIDVPKSLPAPERRDQLRKLWGFDAVDFVIGVLGASTFEKGHDLAIAALGVLRESLPSARLVIAGDKSATNDRQLQLNTSASTRTVFLEISRLDEFFPGIDLFLMPSRAEGLGSSALWAMSYGVPVVATRVGGLPEVIDEGQNGWLVPPNSAESLASAMLEASLNRERLAAFGHAGRRTADRYSAAIMVRETEALYHRILRAAP